MSQSKERFWGYRLKNGEIKVRKYFAYGDISEAKDSPFVGEVVEPFNATGWPEATKQVYGHFGCEVPKP